MTSVSLPAPARPRRSWWRTRAARWTGALLLTVALVLTAVLVLSGSARSQRADDPRSTLPTGSAALRQLLADEGVDVTTTSRVAEVTAQSTPTTTVVVANAQELTPDEALALARAPHARLVLVRPTLLGLRAFGAGATTVYPSTETPDAGCADPAATRAGTIDLTDARAVFRSEAAPQLACYPTGGGYAWLRVAGAAGPVDLVAGGSRNRELAEAGNAAFALNVLGGQPDLIWLVARRSAGPAADQAPGFLPDWWTLALAQLAVALVAVGVWRGRRLGPIMTEPLPVRVRAAETVEGHGRLYQRIAARDRAADALRRGARRRLSAAYGHADDPDLLAAALADRTGRSTVELRAALAGPVPPTDDDLVALALALDRIEQEARRT